MAAVRAAVRVVMVMAVNGIQTEALEAGLLVVQKFHLSEAAVVAVRLVIQEQLTLL
jgi:hypothetical protein